MNNFYATKNQPTNYKTTGNIFSLKLKTQWLVMTFAFFALLAGNAYETYACGGSGSCTYHITNAGSIEANEANCGTFDPANITNVTSPSGGSGTIYYIWQKSTDGGATWTTISGATSDSYNPGSISQTTKYKRGARRSSCDSYMYSNIVTKTVNPIPPATITYSGSLNLCTGGSIVLNANTGSGYDYKWYRNGTIISGATSSSYTVTQAGNYKVLVNITATGCCQYSAEVCVTINNCCDNVTNGGTIGSDETNCGPYDPANITNVTSPTGGSGALEYIWQSLVGQGPWVTISGATSATYDPSTITETTCFKRLARRAGCTDYVGVSNIVVKTVNPLPPAEITYSGSLILCTGGSIVLQASTGTGYDYKWYRNGTLISGATASSYTVTQAGNYKVLVNITATGCCRYSSEVTVTVNSCCDNVTNGGTIAADQSNCGPFDVALLTSLSSPSGGSGALEIVWITRTWSGSSWGSWNMISGATGLTYDPGLVSVNTQFRRCARRAGCTDYIGESNIITITINTGISVSCSPTNGTCTNGNLGSATVNPSGGSGYTYLWNNGATTQTITGLAAGTYSVGVISANGCAASCSVTISTVACCNITQPGEIGYDEQNCGSFDPAEIVSLTSPSGGLGNLEIVWIYRTWNGTSWSSWNMISGADGLSYDPSIITVTTQFRRCARRSDCTDYIGESNIITKTVNPGIELTCNMTNVTSYGGSNGIAAVTILGGTAPYAYLWNNGATTASLNNVYAGVYSVTVTDANGCTAFIECCVCQPPLDCVGFRTQTQGGWGATPNGGNPGAYLHTNFAAAFSSGLQVGCTNLLRLTTAQAITDFLPSGSTASGLPSGTLTNPGNSYNNVFAGQVVALTLSVGFDQYDANFAPSTTLLKNLLINSGTFAGWTVQQLLDEANRKLGGCASSYSFSQLNDAVSRVNENFVDGNITGSYLACCGDMTANCSSQPADCYGASTGSVSVSLTGAVTPISYLWSNGATTASVSNLSAGTYSVTVTDAHNCTAICSVTVNQPDSEVSAQCTSVNGTCSNNNLGSASVNATGGTAPFSYLWSNGSTTASISGLGAGTYSVTVTDANGCSIQCAATVTVTPCCNVTDGGQIGYDQENCGAFDVAELVTLSPPTGGLGNLEIVWITRSWTGSNWSNWEMISGATGLTYNPGVVSVTTQYRRCARRAGCTDYIGESNIITITVNPNPTTQCTSTNGTCTNNNLGSASVTVTSGTAPFTYLWSNGATTASISGLGAGTYSVTVTDAEGCTAQCAATVTITPCCNVTNGGQIGTEQENCGPFDPNAITSIQDPTGGLGTIEYVWLYNHNQVPFNNGQNGWVEIPNSNSASYDPGQISQTTCYIRCSRRSGCTDYVGESNVVCMIVNPVPTTQCTSTNGTCTNNNLGSASVTVTSGTAPFTYLWSNGATTASISGLGAGTYSVTVTDAEGCSAQCAATVTVTPCCNVTDGGQIGYDQENCGAFDPNELVNLAPPTGGLGDLEVLWIYRVWTGTGWENDWHFVPGSHDLLSYDPGMITVSTQFRRCARRSGCEDYIGETNIITITINPVPTAQCSKTDALCYGELTGSASVNASGGTAPYSYVWSNGGTDATISGIGAGVYSVTVTDAEGCTATCSTEVTQPEAALVAQCSSGDASCYEAQDGNASVNVSGGTAPYSYVWSNGATTAFVDGLSAGVYSVTVTDAQGCTTTCSAEVGEASILEILCSGTPAACQGDASGSAGVSAQGGTAPYSYLWSNGATDATINGLSAGTYSVVVTDAHGCSDQCSYTVEEPSDLSAQCSANDVLCFDGNDGSVSVVASGGIAPYTYLWSNGSTDATVNGLTAGVYSVTVTDANGCTEICTAVVGQPQEELLATCEAGPVSCYGAGDGEAVVLAQGGTAPYTYFWNNEMTEAFIENLVPGTYTVIVTDANGCTATCSVEVTEPEPFNVTVNADGPTTFCEGGSVTLTASAAASYVWSPNGETTQSIVVSTSGNYSVWVSDETGCEATSDPVIVTVNPNPTPEVSADGPTTFCEGGSVTLTSTAAATYLWSPNGETTQSIVVSASGNYSVFVTDENGCEGTSAPVSVTVNPNPTPEVSADGPTTFCEGGSVTLTSTAAVSYVWSPGGETTQSITVSASGSYSVFVVDENGCEGTSAPVSVTVNPNPTPEVSADGPTTFCEGGSVTLTSSIADVYVWTPTGETTQSIVVTESGDYSVWVMDENGCEGTSSPVTVIVNTVEPPVIDVDGEPSVCAGECVDLTVLYSGESPNFLWSTGETSQVITVCETGTFTVTYTAENGCSATSEPVTITINPNPTSEITADGPTTFCEGGCVTLTADGGYSSYLWSSGETTQSITVCESGQYIVTVFDENGCRGVADINVVVNPNPTPEVSADGPTTFCEGECVVLTSSEAASYLWSNGATSQSITVCEAGDYSVSVVDENGCEGISAPVSVIVNSNPTPIISASGPTAFCEGECVTLTSSLAANYLWSNGAITQSITVCESGSFTVSVVDENGCEGTSAPVVVTVNPNPVPTISADGPTTFCAGNCVTLTATSSASYLWTNGATTQSITVCESGDYGVSVVDENGCQGGSVPVSVSVLEVEPPVINVDGSSIVCAGECVDLVALYSGENPNFVWSTGEVTQIITVCESGSYTVTITAENGCVATSEPVVITVNPNPTPEVSADGPTTFCEGECVTLTSSEAASYLWSNGATTQSITVCESGSYSVTVTDDNGCSATSDPVGVTVNVGTTPTVTADGPTSICQGTCVTLTASAGASYLWSNGATTQSIMVCAEGSFTVTVTDENGCVATSDPVNVSVIPGPTPEISPEGPIQICEGGCVTLSTAFSGEIGYFLWSTGETTQTITVCESGDYYVTVTDENGCSGTSADTVHVEIGQPVSPIVTADGPTEICEGDSVTLTANSPNAVSYQWYQNGIAIQGATGQSITVSDFADFYVVVTDQYGCTAQSNIVLVKVGVVPVVTVEDATICPGDEITLTANGATYYVWSNGATTQSITVSPDEASDYIVTGTNPFCNLSDSDTATVSISDLPVAEAHASDDPSLGNPVNFTDVSGDNSIVSWFWNFGDGNTGTTQNTHHTYDTEGTFTVVLTVENQYGCAAYDTLEVDINQVILIPNIITPNNDGLNDGFGIKNNGVDEYGLTIFNRWGQIVFERQAREIQWNGTTNSGTDLEAGTYFYVLVVDNGSKGTFEKTGFITLVR